jgi:Flp pilus assembly protein TadC
MDLGSLVDVAGVAALAAVGVFLLVWSLASARPGDVELVARRLRSYAGAEPMTVEELELGESLWERMFGPSMRQIRRALSSVTPASSSKEMERLLSVAGRPYGLTGPDYQALRVVLGLVGAVIGGVVGFTLGQAVAAVLLIVVGGVTGYWAPRLWLRRMVSSRQREITRALPNALDLLSVSVEAGLGFEVAMRRVADRYENALSDEFDKVLVETGLGRPRVEAIRAMGQRTGVPDLQHFANAVVQSQQLGTGISTILKVQAEEIRRRRYLRARESGARAPLKMLMPMIGCIFPTLWVVLLGPAALLLFSTFRAGH